ncbi:UNVERIFIED_CONTAM: hypothetical protein GTU68_030656 [Idotea baltica]|nr:hypothetical protein [Idotea baltica]
MPELPEVETVIRNIKPKIMGKKISKMELPNSYKRVLGGKTLSFFNKKIQKNRILDVTRRAKYIVLQLENGVIAIHLRMTGRLMTEITKEDKKYTSVKINFTDKSALFFRDVRKFGRFDFYNNFSELNNKLGVEPLSSDFNLIILKELCSKRKKRMKHFLLDQTLIAGLGNIYVDEALFAANIHPESLTNKIPTENLKKLCSAIKKILKKSIESNGTTFSSFYYGDNEKGSFESTLKVYGRTNKNCYKCKSKIVKLKVQQRGTHVCNECQTLFN